MSSYNNIEKIKYSSSDCIVTLLEYIVFEDELAEEKYVVFKFSNNVSQQLLGMEFEVCQYDVEGCLIEKSIVVYNKFLAKADKCFVPDAKLKVNYLLKTLSVRLVKAAFDRFVWKEGEYLDNSYKFEHYASDIDRELPPKIATPTGVGACVAAVKPASCGPQIPFTVKNTTRKNIAKFPGVFNALVCFLAFVASGVSVWLFSTNSSAFTIDGYDLKLISKSEMTVAVTGCERTEKDLVIPARLGDYTVVRICTGAFKDSKIESVTFDSSLYIEDFAFENCTNLKTVASSAEITVSAEAFKNCKQLTNINLPYSAWITEKSD